MGFIRSLRTARSKVIALQKQGNDVDLVVTASINGRKTYINCTLIEDVTVMLMSFTASWTVIILTSKLLHHGGAAGF